VSIHAAIVLSPLVAYIIKRFILHSPLGHTSKTYEKLLHNATGKVHARLVREKSLLTKRGLSICESSKILMQT